MTRAGAFVLVGASGFLVQLSSLAALTSLAGWHWLSATLASVEFAVVHNFLWHERWTWRDRIEIGARDVAWRFVEFNGGNGLASLAGNSLVRCSPACPACLWSPQTRSRSPCWPS